LTEETRQGGFFAFKILGFAYNWIVVQNSFTQGYWKKQIGFTPLSGKSCGITDSVRDLLKFPLHAA
jgi:hypothetical protein